MYWSCYAQVWVAWIKQGLEQIFQTGQCKAESHLTGFLLPTSWTRLDGEDRILLEKQVLCAADQKNPVPELWPDRLQFRPMSDQTHVINLVSTFNEFNKRCNIKGISVRMLQLKLVFSTSICVRCHEIPCRPYWCIELQVTLTFDPHKSNESECLCQIWENAWKVVCMRMGWPDNPTM